MKPDEFWNANLGRFLVGERLDCAASVAKALSQNYLHGTKETFLRLGAGKAASLVMDGQAILMADIRLPHGIAPSLKIMPGSWRTVPNWMAAIIMSPPPAPFMFVIYGKNPSIQNKFRLNVSPDVVEICGAQQLRCRPSVVRRALEAIGDTPPTVWRKAAFIDDRCQRDPLSRFRKSWEEQLDKLHAKHPHLFDLLAALPPFGSGDYEATTLVHAVRMKDAARSSDEVIQQAA